MYIAAVRIAHDFGCDAIGIQYQQGLKDMVPASDLAEGLLNNAERPPVFAEGGKEELYAGGPVVHFNEVDECAGVDALITNRCWSALGLDPSTTLHDVRWGEHYKGDGLDAFVWLLQISGAAPANHFTGGYAGASSERQPAMYFPLGGGSLKGVGKPGEIVWSRVFVEGGTLHADLGRGTVVTLPAAETERRWKQTTYAMAHRECGLPRRRPESIHGPPPRQPRQRCVCALSRGSRQGDCDQGRHDCGVGHHRASLREHAVKLGPR